jgi:phage virion morphogenesis protein
MSDGEIVGAVRLNDTIDRMIQALSAKRRKMLLTRITRRIAAENREHIAANVTPDGTPFAPRKRKGKAGHIKMFRKLKTAKWLKAKTYADEGVVFFYGGAAEMARQHHYGLRARLSRTLKKRVQMPARPLLGISENDKSLIEDMILEAFSEAL